MTMRIGGLLPTNLFCINEDVATTRRASRAETLLS